MDLSSAESELLLLLIGAAATIIPTAAFAVKAYLQAKANQWQINQRPTHDEVNAKISSAVQQALETNGHTE